MHRRHKPLKPKLPTSSFASKELNDTNFGHKLSRRPMCQYHLPFQKYLPQNRKLLILPIWLHMANKPQCIIEMPFKVQMLVIGKKLWTTKLTCSPNVALGNLNHYQKAERQSVAIGHTQSKLAQKVKSPDTKLSYVCRDTCRSLVLISMIHMHQLFILTPFVPYSIWWHLMVGIEVKMMPLAHF